MLKLGLDSFSYHLHLEHADGRKDIHWFLGRVLDLGLDGCQIDPRHLNNWDENLVFDIGKFCLSNGLYLELGTGGFDYDRLSRRLELAAAAGACVVRTFIGGHRRTTSEPRRKQLIRWAIENFKLLSQVAERIGITLALENHEDLTSSEVVSILKAVDSPFVRACVDTGNALPVGEDCVECVRNLAPYAASVHLKDWKYRFEGGVAVYEGCALGQGDARVAEVYAILRSEQPNMPITMEIATVSSHGFLPSLEQEEANIRASVEFIRREESKLLFTE